MLLLRFCQDAARRLPSEVWLLGFLCLRAPWYRFGCETEPEALTEEEEKMLIKEVSAPGKLLFIVKSSSGPLMQSLEPEVISRNV